MSWRRWSPFSPSNPRWSWCRPKGRAGFSPTSGAASPRVPLEKKSRLTFYEEAKSSDTALVIATGEQRIYANILLVVGVVIAA